MKSGLVVALALLLAAPGTAQPSPNIQTQAADVLLGPDQPDRPGGVVMVARGDEIVYQRAFGGADLEQGTPIRTDTRFHVASVSKQFTAFAAALLAHEGRLDLDADIRTYLPEMRDYGTPIRVRQLMHHTSGLRDQWDLTVLSGTNMQSLIRQDGLIALIAAQQGLNFAPGTAYRYSNSGYALLAEIVARQSGMPFRHYLQQRVFAPLGMADTLVADSAAEIIARRAQSYRVLPNGSVELFRLNFENYGATSLITTAGDLLRWARELLRPRVFDPALIRSLSAQARLTDGTALAYGMGVTTAPVAGLRVIGHGGADAGYRAFFAVYPERDAAVIMMFNHVVDVARTNEQLARIFLNPPSPAPAVLAPTELASYAGTFASNWAPAMRLQVRDGRLLRSGGQEPQAAIFRDDGTVTFGESQLPFRPVRGDGGPVMAWEESPPGLPPIRYARIADATPLAAELAGLIGEYRSAEVDATWWVTAEGDRLFASTLRAPRKNPLVPLDRDHWRTKRRPLSRPVVTVKPVARPSAPRSKTSRAKPPASKRYGNPDHAPLAGWRMSSYRPDPVILQLGTDFYDPVQAANFPQTLLRFRNDRAAGSVGLEGLDNDAWARHFGRFEPLSDNLTQPLALRYHGHQFRVYNPDIGDGRGFLFAQMCGSDNRLLDLGTKGSGQTPHSRFGDGRLTLKGGVREVLATEMLEALGVDTSRTFSLIETGEALERNDEPSPTRAAVLVRLQYSHIRIGTFQRLAYLDQPDNLRALTAYCLRHYFDEEGGEDAPERLLGHVVRETARLAASYIAAGFVHGVLNSDNIAITAQSFDYGPWRWTPFWDDGFTAAYFDHSGLYSFARQPEAIHWDVVQLAQSLRLIAEAEPLTRALGAFPALFHAALAGAILARLGVESRGEEDAALIRLIEQTLSTHEVTIDRFFFDWRGGALRKASPADPIYGAEGFADLRAALGRYQTVPGALDHPHWSDDAPQSMHIEEVESIWARIDADDDWSALHAKVAAVRRMGEALKAGG